MAVMDYLQMLGVTVPEGVDMDAILSLTADRRPPCLVEARADEAQAYLIAYMLEVRRASTAMIAPGMAYEEVTGDLTTKISTTTKSATVSPLADFYKGQFDALAGLCSGGALMVGTRRESACGFATYADDLRPAEYP